LSAIALWVASQARTTSRDAQQTSQAAVTLSLMPTDKPSGYVWVEGVPDRRKSSSTGEDLPITYTSRGEQLKAETEEALRAEPLIDDRGTPDAKQD
jgi:hypothetical protein